MPCIDIPEGIRRTGGNRALYMRFLSQFPFDPSMRTLKQALDGCDLHSAFLSAHTLKGLCAQLGMGALSAQAAVLCELLRAQNPAALRDARARYPALLALYEQAVCEINTL